MKTYMCIGAGPRIGVATARRFGREGYRVVLVSRSARDNEYLAARFADEDIDVVFETADASNPAEIASLMDRYADRPLDVVHYNAAAMRFDGTGALVMQGIESQSTDELTTDITVNVSSALVALAKVIPAMTTRGEGTILLTGGGLGVEPSADLLTLSIGKAATRSIAQALFEPLKAHGVHVATVRVSTLVASDPEHPGRIAEAFWSLHAQPAGAWTWETLYPVAD